VDGLDPVSEPRPAREVVGNPNWVGWAGYLQRRFMIADRARCLLESATEAQVRGNYALYMRREWAPLLVRHDELAWDGGEPRIPPHALAANSPTPPGHTVRQVSYGLDELRYEARLRAPAIMIENEMYFPGWTAVLENRRQRREIRAFAANGVFRAWELPAGAYRMTARFRTPYLGLSTGVSVAGLAAWVIAAVLWRRWRSEEASTPGGNGSLA
jgi:hypothetical protein